MNKPYSAGRPLLLLILLLALQNTLAANPCSEEPGGIGGTGNSLPVEPSDPGGMGGTGVVGSAPGGIGGTGAQARSDVGVYGAITGFASICANGIEIHYDHRTHIKGRSSLLGRPFAIGQVVAVQANGTGSELNARRIVVVYEVSGPITAVDPDRSRIAVMGREIDVSQVEAVFDVSGSSTPVSTLKNGHFIHVSGLRRADGSIEASYLGLARSGSAAVRGRFMRNAAGPMTISGVPIKLPLGTDVPDVTDVSLRGQWDGKVLVGKALERNPISKLLEGLPRLELQGFARAERDELYILGKNVSIDDRTQYVDGNIAHLGIERKVQVTVRVLPDQRLVAERVMFKNAGEDRPSRGNRSPDKARTATHGDSATTPNDSPRESDWVEGKGASTDATGMTKVEKPEKRETPEKQEKPARPEKTERPEKAEKPEKLEKPARPEKIERPEKPDTIDRPEKPEKIERPEKPQRPEKVQKIEKPQRPDRPKR